MPTTQNPTFLTVETHEGRATLGGKRRLLDDFSEAAEVAEEIDGQIFALEPVEAVDITPVSASAHVRLIDIPALTFEPEVVAVMACPCGARAELHEGGDCAEWDALVASHGECRAEVA